MTSRSAVSSGTAAIATAAILCSAGVAASLYFLQRKRPNEVEDEPQAKSKSTAVANGTCHTSNDQMDLPAAPALRTDLRSIQRPGTITIAYATTTNTTKALAESLYEHLELKVVGGASSRDIMQVQICRVEELDWWDQVLNPELSDEQDDDDDGDGSNGQDVSTDLPKPIVLFILPTWTNGTLPPSSQPLLASLSDIATDWRVSPNPLRPSRISVGAFGIGSSGYDPHTFCKPAKSVVEKMLKLGAARLVPVGTGDVESGDYRDDFRVWMDSVMDSVEKHCLLGAKTTSVASEQSGDQIEKGCFGGNGTCSETRTEGNNQTTTSCGCTDNTDMCNGEATIDEEEEKCGEEDEYEYGDDPFSDKSDEEDDVMDLEDIGDAMNASSQERKRNESPKEMVTPKQATALKKEGYKLIGTHSAVKLCRWTKHQLRGRGGCYKHTHYGITSYQCMEATPSLACANKCVFCWRHHKNPVGREWRWKTDDPVFIVEEAVNMHVKMIRETKGIPGVRMDRWKEAHTVRHCALSLVGEPIMYPRIGELLAELHKRKISTFLVTNGQHPDAIESLPPITQLYVSVDASTPESLEAIDRPLFRDAWDRLRRSLTVLRNKGQRTVARLTVVKGWNSDEVEGYAKLIALGHCSLVEIKGVTFCGKSDASNLNMSNTPWHHEVVAIATKLRDELNAMHEAGGANASPRYELACEHKHSVSVLLARVDQFATEDPATGERKWRTWIDYDKFQVLAAKATEDPEFTFGVEDYTAETPSWAVFGSNEEGFDPSDQRHRKKNKHPKYTKFDDEGVPTHNHAGEALGEVEMKLLRDGMLKKLREVSNGSTVAQDGEVKVEDASLMYRGLTITL